MSSKLAARLIIDFMMTLLLLSAFDYRIAREAPHEWIGISIGALFILHNVINLHWYKNIFKGKYHFKRVITTIVNLLLLVTMATLIISGLMQSRSVLAFLHLPGGMFLRQIHTTAAYCGLLLIAVHVGVHWEMIMNAFRKMFKITGKNNARRIILRTIAVLIVVCGLWASFDRDIFSKLFHGVTFDFWNPERPVILFYIANLSIMGIYVFLTYYLLKLVEIGKRKRHITTIS
ncbi:membrane protein [Spirochaetia bacterium]|nr:membrane protein [Spirochaetia bacterium]